MVSSLSIFFIVAFYLFFKQRYQKRILLRVNDPEEGKLLKVKLKRKLMIFPVGIIAIVILYLISYILMNRYPEVDTVKSSRRVVDVIATLLCVVVFFIDKRELDKKLKVKKKPGPPFDSNEPGITITEDIELN